MEHTVILLHYAGFARSLRSFHRAFRNQTTKDSMMKFDIYGRFHVDVRREAHSRVVYRSELGKRTRLYDVAIPPSLVAQELATYLDDIFHELASVGQNVEVVIE